MSVTTPTAGAPQAHSSQHDVVSAIRAHHEELEQAVAAGSIGVRDTAERLGDVAARRDALVLLLLEEVMPHAAAEERTLYDVGGTLPATAVLVRSMIAEHRRLQALVNDLARARTPVAMAAGAAAVRALFEAHLATENDHLLPALVEADVDLRRLLEGMHEILGGGHPVAAEDAGCGCGGCGCGDQPVAPDVDLDVRSLPPALRHERIFAAVDALEPSTSFELCNDHDPLPLRYQLDAERPGQITWDYLEQGPTVWRVRIGRAA